MRTIMSKISLTSFGARPSDGSSSNIIVGRDIKARLIAKRPTNYVDATNLTPQERQHWIKLARDYNYEVQAVFFDVPLEVCLERHQRRDRVVPEDVMRRMAAKLKPPSFAEGFAKITVVRVKKKEE